ncbi:MAG: hypothetical protein FWD12_11815 [Alphaproteobacteria bacterium]|nr:hypothetical protein [Alphaproteobacteria bacterium]
MAKAGPTTPVQAKVQEKRGPGRPSTGGRGIGVLVRFPPAEEAALEALDEWIAAQEVPLTRPEAIRLLIARGVAASPPARRARAKGKR